MIKRSEVRRQSALHAPFPVEGLPLLPAYLRAAIAGPLWHARLSTGEEETAVEDLGRGFWSRHSLRDAQLVVQALVKRVNWSQQSTRDFLTRMRIPFAADLESLTELSLSDRLLKRLEEEELLDPHSLSCHTALRAIAILQLRPRQLLELLAALEIAGAIAVPSDAPADYPGLQTYPASTDTKTQLSRILRILGTHDVHPRDIRFTDLLAKLSTKPGSLKTVLRQLRAGIKRAGNRDPWPAVLPVLVEIEARLMRFRACNLEEALKDVLQLVLGLPRQAERVALRLGWHDGRPRTLREAAANFGVTGDLIRRHEFTVRMRINRGTPSNSRGSWYCPQLSEAIQIAQSLAPCPTRTVVQALRARGVTKLEWTLDTLLDTADLFGIDHGMVVERSTQEERLALAGRRAVAP